MKEIRSWNPVNTLLKRRGQNNVAPDEWIYGPLGTYKPMATPDHANDTCGIPKGTVLTRHDGNITCTVAGTVYDKLDMYGLFDIRAPGVRIKRSRIRGGVITAQKGLVTALDSACRDLVIEDCELAPDNPGPLWEGVYGHDYTVKRCNIYHLHHAIRALNTYGAPNGLPTNVKVWGNYIHHLCFNSPDPTHSNNMTHNDLIHWDGGDGLEIVGNNLPCFLSSAQSHTLPDGSVLPPDPWGYVGNADTAAPAGGTNPYYPHPQGNAALMIGSAMENNPTGLSCRKNWMDGGAVTINIGTNASYPNAYSAAIPCGDIIDNRHGRNSDGPSHNNSGSYFVYGGIHPGLNITGNVNDNDGTPVIVR